MKDSRFFDFAGLWTRIAGDNPDFVVLTLSYSAERRWNAVECRDLNLLGELLTPGSVTDGSPSACEVFRSQSREEAERYAGGGQYIRPVKAGSGGWIPFYPG